MIVSRIVLKYVIMYISRAAEAYSYCSGCQTVTRELVTLASFSACGIC